MEKSLCSKAPGHEVCGLTIVDTVCTSPTFLWRGLYSFKLFAACNQGGKTSQSFFFSGQLASFIWSSWCGSFSSRSPDMLVHAPLTLLLTACAGQQVIRAECARAKVSKESAKVPQSHRGPSRDMQEANYSTSREVCKQECSASMEITWHRL